MGAVGAKNGRLSILKQYCHRILIATTPRMSRSSLAPVRRGGVRFQQEVRFSKHGPEVRVYVDNETQVDERPRDGDAITSLSLSPSVESGLRQQGAQTRPPDSDARRKAVIQYVDDNESKSADAGTEEEREDEASAGLLNSKLARAHSPPRSRRPSSTASFEALATASEAFTADGAALASQPSPQKERPRINTAALSMTLADCHPSSGDAQLHSWAPGASQSVSSQQDGALRSIMGSPNRSQKQRRVSISLPSADSGNDDNAGDAAPVRLASSSSSIGTASAASLPTLIDGILPSSSSVISAPAHAKPPQAQARLPGSAATGSNSADSCGFSLATGTATDGTTDGGGADTNDDSSSRWGDDEGEPFRYDEDEEDQEGDEGEDGDVKMGGAASGSSSRHLCSRPVSPASAAARRAAATGDGFGGGSSSSSSAFVKISSHTSASLIHHHSRHHPHLPNHHLHGGQSHMMLLRGSSFGSSASLASGGDTPRGPSDALGNNITSSASGVGRTLQHNGISASTGPNLGSSGRSSTFFISPKRGVGTPTSETTDAGFLTDAVRRGHLQPGYANKRTFLAVASSSSHAMEAAADKAAASDDVIDDDGANGYNFQSDIEMLAALSESELSMTSAGTGGGGRRGSAAGTASSAAAGAKRKRHQQSKVSQQTSNTIDADGDDDNMAASSNTIAAGMPASATAIGGARRSTRRHPNLVAEDSDIDNSTHNDNKSRNDTTSMAGTLAADSSGRDAADSGIQSKPRAKRRLTGSSATANSSQVYVADHYENYESLSGSAQQPSSKARKVAAALVVQEDVSTSLPQSGPPPIPPSWRTMVTLNPAAIAADEQRLWAARSLLQRQAAELEAQKAWLDQALASAELDPFAFAAAVARTQTTVVAAATLLRPEPYDAAPLSKLYQPGSAAASALAGSTYSPAESAAAGGTSTFGSSSSSSYMADVPLLQRLVVALRLEEVDPPVLAQLARRGLNTGESASASASAIRSAEDDPITSAPFLPLPYRLKLCPFPLADGDAQSYRLLAALLEAEETRRRAPDAES